MRNRNARTVAARAAAQTALLALLLAGIFYAVPAVAQDDGGDTVSEGETFTEEVTVTARKREETLQEVPFSVVATTEEVLRDRGATTLAPEREASGAGRARRSSLRLGVRGMASSTIRVLGTMYSGRLAEAARWTSSRVGSGPPSSATA